MVRFITALTLAAVSAGAADLAVTEFALRRSEGGSPFSTGVFGPGQPVFAVFQVTNFTVSGEDRDVHVVWSAELRDPSGRLTGDTKTGEVKVQLAPEDKEWKPRGRPDFLLPPVPEPGTWTIAVAVEDKLGGKRATAQRTFQVESPGYVKLDGIGLANFRFLRTESESSVLPPGGAFHPGDTVWARFDVGGYKFGSGNRYDVRYGLALRDSTGKVLFSEPKAAAESDAGPYPKHSVSALFNLKLDRNIAPGEYTLAITLTDGVSGQTAESLHTFRVEK